EMKISDPSQIVIDEVSGQLITLMFIPLEPMWYLCGFILFRFLDIRKPWPIRWFDTNIKGGAGIMLDDIVAGIFACVILLLSHRFYVMLIGGI
ncbi:MAG: phosphatidylglycerophosphatase A, partial [Rhodospirillaceae bacterium]|nr:phosphatidylglycerophosphatase A [Rhodospirillaceae bacterium]